MLNELQTGKAIGLRGVQNEMLRFCPSYKLTTTIAMLFDTMLNEQTQPDAFNISLLKPIIKDDKKPNTELNNTTDSYLGYDPKFI
jgi:hypothetical protein